MKRNALFPRPVSHMDIAKDVPAEQLAALGRCCLEYNRAEESLEWALLRGLDLPWAVWRDVTTRINGIDGKVAIIKATFRDLRIAAEDIKAFEDSLTAFQLYKTYRDAIIHTRIFDPGVPVGLHWQRQGKLTEALISTEALNGLSQRLSLLTWELSQMVQVLHYTQEARGTYKNQSGPPFEPGEAEKAILKCRVQLTECQNLRKALPSLPEFPDEY